MRSEKQQRQDWAVGVIVLFGTILAIVAALSYRQVGELTSKLTGWSNKPVAEISLGPIGKLPFASPASLPYLVLLSSLFVALIYSLRADLWKAD